MVGVSFLLPILWKRPYSMHVLHRSSIIEPQAEHVIQEGSGVSKGYYTLRPLTAPMSC